MTAAAANDGDSFVPGYPCNGSEIAGTPQVDGVSRDWTTAKGAVGFRSMARVELALNSGAFLPIQKVGRKQDQAPPASKLPVSAPP